MIATQFQAREIIKAAYPDMPFRFTKSCQIGVRPVCDPRPTLAWRKLATGPLATVWIGRLLPTLDIDWDYTP